MAKRCAAWILLAILLASMMPAAMADSRVYEILDKVSLDSRGYTVVSWEDSVGLAPYTVSYEYVDSSSDAVQVRYRAADNLTVKSYALIGLIPGRTYRIFVFDRNSTYTSKLITVPTKGNISSTRKSKTTLTPMYSQNGGKPKTLKTMSASAMMRNMAKGYSYGLQYRTEFYSKASKEIVHDALFALYAPNGYVDTNYADDFTLPKKANMAYYYSFIGSNFFDTLLELNDTIPVGTYRFEIYLEGKYFYGNTFYIKE